MQKEAIRYLSNAKEILGRSPIENNAYTDIKYVKSAFGVVYLGVLQAIDDCLLKRGLTKKELPKKVDEYRKALQRHVAAHNGKTMREFDMLYDALHIAGYYRGLIYNVSAVKDYIKAARIFIEKMR